MQEISGDDRREAGRIPRTIECELTADLVDSCVPGDMVTITAVVKATGSEEGELYKVYRDLQVVWGTSVGVDNHNLYMYMLEFLDYRNV